jgi:hypothetical protein
VVGPVSTDELGIEDDILLKDDSRMSLSSRRHVVVFGSEKLCTDGSGNGSGSAKN